MDYAFLVINFVEKLVVQGFDDGVYFRFAFVLLHEFSRFVVNKNGRYCFDPEGSVQLILFVRNDFDVLYGVQSVRMRKNFS